MSRTTNDVKLHNTNEHKLASDSESMYTAYS